MKKTDTVLQKAQEEYAAPAMSMMQIVTERGFAESQVDVWELKDYSMDTEDVW